MQVLSVPDQASAEGRSEICTRLQQSVQGIQQRFAALCTWAADGLTLPASNGSVPAESALAEHGASATLGAGQWTWAGIVLSQAAAWIAPCLQVMLPPTLTCQQPSIHSTMGISSKCRLNAMSLSQPLMSIVPVPRPKLLQLAWIKACCHACVAFHTLAYRLYQSAYISYAPLWHGPACKLLRLDVAGLAAICQCGDSCHA